MSERKISPKQFVLWKSRLGLEFYPAYARDKKLCPWTVMKKAKGL